MSTSSDGPAGLLSDPASTDPVGSGPAARGPVAPDPGGVAVRTDDDEASARVRRPGLSPSRANDFQQCPLLFRYRVLDRLPEPPSPAAARGTLVHAVLEMLFDLPPDERTMTAAVAMLPQRWTHLRAEEPRYLDLFADPQDEVGWLDSARDLLARYFELEDPTHLSPRARELKVTLQLDDGPELRGIIDRVDVAPNGWVRIVDYKTGRSPRPGYEANALFQMRFYAFVVWRTRGVLPRRLQLTYLGDGAIVQHEPSQAEMATFEARIRALWQSIQDTARTGQWSPRPSPLCSWCSFRELCPQFGGTPPPIPEGATERAVGLLD